MLQHIYLRALARCDFYDKLRTLTDCSNGFEFFMQLFQCKRKHSAPRLSYDTKVVSDNHSYNKVVFVRIHWKSLTLQSIRGFCPTETRRVLSRGDLVLCSPSSPVRSA